MKRFAMLFCSAVILYSCQEKKTLEQNIPPKLEAATPECYLKVVGRDSIMLQLLREGDSVHGVFNWKPYEKDTKLSNFKGVVTNGKAKTIAHVSAEGMNTDEALDFTIQENSVAVKYGEMEQRPDGIWHYKPGTVTSEEVLPKVNCP